MASPAPSPIVHCALVTTTAIAAMTAFAVVHDPQEVSAAIGIGGLVLVLAVGLASGGIAALAAAGRVPSVLLTAGVLPWLVGVVLSTLQMRSASMAMAAVSATNKLPMMQQATGEALMVRGLGGALTAGILLGTGLAFLKGRGALMAKLTGAGVALVGAGLALRSSLVAQGVMGQLTALAAAAASPWAMAADSVPLADTFALAGVGLAAVGALLAIVGAARGRDPALIAWVVVGAVAFTVPVAAEFLTWRSQATDAADVPRPTFAPEGFTPITMVYGTRSDGNVIGVIVGTDGGMIPVKQHRERTGDAWKYFVDEGATPAVVQRALHGMRSSDRRLVIVGPRDASARRPLSSAIDAFLPGSELVELTVPFCAAENDSDVVRFDGSADAGVTRLKALLAGPGCAWTTAPTEPTPTVEP